MALPVRNKARGATSKTEKSDKGSKGGASKGSGKNMPGTTDADDDDDDTVYVSKRPPPPHGKYRARVKGCGIIRNRDGDRVLDKFNNPLPPKLEFIVDDPAELEKAKSGTPSQHGEVIGELLGTDQIGRQRTMKICAGLGYPESEWEETPKGLRFPLKQLDALKDDGRYWLIDCKTSNGTGDKKDVPYTHIESVTPWIPPKDKKPKKDKKPRLPEPEPEEEEIEEVEEETDEIDDSDESEDDQESDENDDSEDDSDDEDSEESDESEDDDIPF